MRKYILVLDSGLGGVSVLNELKKQMPNKSFIYYADSKNAPYGNKKKEAVKEFVFDAVKKLQKEYEIELMVVACNTASSVCLQDLREKFKFSVIGVSPEIGVALRDNPDKKILVMCTQNTWKNNRKVRLLRKTYKSQLVFLKPKKLAYLVDENMDNMDNLKPYLDKLLTKKHKNVDAVVLGCTHYNFLQSQLKPYFKKGTKFYSDIKAVSDRVNLMFNSEKGKGEKGEIIVKSSNTNKDYLNKMKTYIK